MSMEHMKRMAAMRDEAVERDKAELPKVAHHHFSGYNAEEQAEHGMKLKQEHDK